MHPVNRQGLMLCYGRCFYGCFFPVIVVVVNGALAASFVNISVLSFVTALMSLLLYRRTAAVLFFFCR